VQLDRNGKEKANLTTKDLARQSRNQKRKMDITTKHTKSTKEENIFLSDSRSSPLSGLRGLPDLRGENVFRQVLHPS